MPGWGQEDLMPLAKKLETFHQDEAGIDRCKHGYDGPVHVSGGGFRGKSEVQFMDTVKEMGYQEIVDLQDMEQVGGFFRWQRYVSPDGKRQDAAYRYIHPLLQDGQHPNLHIPTESKVVRVVFDDSSPPRAIGVEYKPNQDAQPSTSLSKPVHQIVKASKLVVVSAGALGTPQVLERSGVGNPEIPNKLSIPVVSAVPGVGENYQDHQLLLYPYKSSLDPEETIDCIFSGRKDFVKAVSEKDPMLGWNGIDIAAKLRIPDNDIAKLGRQYEEEWKRDFVPHPTKPALLCGIINAFLADPNLVTPGQYVTFGTYTAYPYSRGSIHITSASDVLSGYDFSTGFLSHPSDLASQIWAYKMSRRIMRRLPYFQGELDLGHPKFRPESKARLVDLTTPSDGQGRLDEEIEYSVEDDEVIADWIRRNLNITWHSCETCAMRPLERGGVVDGELNVYGTRGLKVADLSMMPENVGANTNNTALIVGQKTAVIIGGELGIGV